MPGLRPGVERRNGGGVGGRFPQPALDIAATPMTLTDPYSTP
ncbi:hypothetical protein PV703_08470 [Streptomyces sp. ME01-24h]|nr:hypothetical protein [Streptomyces sp. ME02-6991-2B]MDX3353353.1 hypothetical protein [Streptomyces sp. ME01-24h]